MKVKEAFEILKDYELNFVLDIGISEFISGDERVANFLTESCVPARKINNALISAVIHGCLDCEVFCQDSKGNKPYRLTEEMFRGCLDNAKNDASKVIKTEEVSWPKFANTDTRDEVKITLSDVEDFARDSDWKERYDYVLAKGEEYNLKKYALIRGGYFTLVFTLINTIMLAILFVKEIFFG